MHVTNCFAIHSFVLFCTWQLVLVKQKTDGIRDVEIQTEKKNMAYSNNTIDIFYDFCGGELFWVSHHANMLIQYAGFKIIDNCR